MTLWLMAVVRKHIQVAKPCCLVTISLRCLLLLLPDGCFRHWITSTTRLMNKPSVLLVAGKPSIKTNLFWVCGGCFHSCVNPCGQWWCVRGVGRGGSLVCRLELRRGAAVSCSQLERNILLIYAGWELVNLFLGGVLSSSLTRCVLPSWHLLAPGGTVGT